MFKKHYSRFLSTLENQLHFAAHSHHAWPDVTREAHLKYWDDSASLWDEKWELVFNSIIPKAQKHIANILQLNDSCQIAFAPNTHELVVRLLSTFDSKRPIRILTTNHEFHSFRRQTQRMEESGQVEIKILDADELATNRKHFIQSVKQELKNGSFDLFFMSQVFFDSGLAISANELEEIVSSAPSPTVLCIDGYHAFGAIPVNLSKLEGRIFYLAGGYKYAQAGEGVCFLVVPKGDWRPVNTGWFAEMETLSGTKTGAVAYPTNGAAFSGSTFDPAGLYRFNAVWDMLQKEGLTVEKIHDHVNRLISLFLSGTSETILKKFPILNQGPDRGHFITFKLGSNEECSQVHFNLKNAGIKTDFRGNRLRFGFGMYHEEQDVLDLLTRLRNIE
jgi:selenocysteine lyase/cysteine desulfurase